MQMPLKQQRKMTSSRKSSSPVARRAWNILRLSFLWARKRGMFRNRLAFSLNLIVKGVKKLRHCEEARGALAYGDRELSFENTPVVHVRMHRPSSMRFQIPCIKPPEVDFDWDFDQCDGGGRISAIYSDGGDGDRDCDDDDDGEIYCVGEDEMNDGCCDEGIDLRAEQFIAQFYEDMRMQRQQSYLRYV